METNLDGRRDREEGAAAAVAAGDGEEMLLGFCPAQARGSAAYIALGPADAGSTGTKPCWAKSASQKIPWAVQQAQESQPCQITRLRPFLRLAATESQLYSGS